MKRFSIASLFIAAAALCSWGAEKTPHVVYIGLDGWGSYSYDKADMPTVKDLAAKGAFTTKKRAVNPSVSAPNWASMFMGAGPELHGYMKWGSQTPEIPSRVILKNGIFPTIFQVYRDAAPEAEIGVLYEWDGIKHLVDTLSLSHYALADMNANPAALAEMTAQYIREKRPQLVAAIFDNPDHVGHKYGHDTPEYYATLHELDGYVARIIQATRDAGIFDDTVFIITADHGGIGKGHGGITLQELETPFIIFGKGIAPTGEFNESMMQYDVAATMAKLLGATPPQVWIGRPIKAVE